jgi:hypothetical protein
MSYTSAYITLDNIVRNTIELAEVDESMYLKYMNLAINCYTNLCMNHIPEGEVMAKLSVDSDLKTVDFPDAMIKWVAIGVPINGKLWTFTRERGVITTTTSGEYDTDSGEGVDLLEDLDAGYSARGSTNDKGYFDVDYVENRFVLKNTTATTVWLVYTVSGIDLDDTDHLINKKYEEVIRAYIMMESNIARRDVPDYYVRRLKMDYEQKLKDVRNSRINFTEILDTFYKLYHLQRRL